MFFIILVTAIKGRPTPDEIHYLPGQLKWTLLPKEGCGDLLCGGGSLLKNQR